MKTSSSMTTPSQMNVCEEILHRSPDSRILLDFDKRANLGFLANCASVQVDQRGLKDAYVFSQANRIGNRHYRTFRQPFIRVSGAHLPGVASVLNEWSP